MSEDTRDPLLNMVLGGYILRESLGSGGSAEVYRGESTTQKRIMRAIKVIRREQTRKLGKRFVEEARLLEELSHPNIVTFHHATEDQGYLVMVLELLRGQTLRAHIDAWRKEGRPPPLDMVIEVLGQASEGVAYAHSFRKGVVHRDIKPENLFVTTDGTTKVLDFGIARALDDAEREAATTTGISPMGTAPYMPPELWHGEDLPSPATDVYSLGITLFEAVTGRHPFEEPDKPKKNAPAMMNAHLTKRIKPLREVRSDAPASLEKIVECATAKESTKRYRSAAEFGEALRAVQEELKAHGKPAEPEPALPEHVPDPSTQAITEVSLPKPAAKTKEVDEPLRTPVQPKEPVKHWRKSLVSGVVAVGIASAIVWQKMPREEMHAAVTNDSSAASSGAPAVPSASASVVPVVMTSANAPERHCDNGMVYIPKGTFKMGADDGDPDEKPAHNVTVEAFCMDRTEVTVADYEACKSCAKADTRNGCNARRADRQDHPINCLKWEHAAAYCKTEGKRLPTEVEWEYDARGTDGRKYPWGNDPPTGKLCWGGEGNERSKGSRESTCSVASFPAGKSFFGVLDMAGNVWEWTSSHYTANYESDKALDGFAMRGGSWDRPETSFIRATNRSSQLPGSSGNDIGFRCARVPF